MDECFVVVAEKDSTWCRVPVMRSKASRKIILLLVVLFFVFCACLLSKQWYLSLLEFQDVINALLRCQSEKKSGTFSSGWFEITMEPTLSGLQIVWMESFRKKYFNYYSETGLRVRCTTRNSYVPNEYRNDFGYDRCVGCSAFWKTWRTTMMKNDDKQQQQRKWRMQNKPWINRRLILLLSIVQLL